jgi:hypothetical protein
VSDLTITPLICPDRHGGVFFIDGMSHPNHAYTVVGGEIMRINGKYGLLTIAIVVLIVLAFF